MRFKIEDLVARRWYWKLTCFHHNIRDILLSVSISVLAASSTWRERKEERKSPKFISLNIPHILRDALLTCMLHAGCYPIMPCKCTRPYSPRVFLYTVCLSVLRCISKSEKKLTKEIISFRFLLFLGSISSRCSGKGPAHPPPKASRERTKTGPESTVESGW